MENYHSYTALPDMNADRISPQILVKAIRRMRKRVHPYIFHYDVVHFETNRRLSRQEIRAIGCFGYMIQNSPERVKPATF